MDVYVTGYTVPGRLFHNSGDGSFVPVTDFRGPASAAMDAAWVDYDNDEDLDLIINFFFEGLLAVYRNEGEGKLVRMTAAEVGELATDETANSAAFAWGDYDNDGDLDLYRTEVVWDWEEDGILKPGRLYVNQGDGKFVRVLAGSPTTGEYGTFYTASWGDYDNDGFLDLFGSRERESGSPVYRNNLPSTGNANRWLKVQCEGRVSNREAIGAKVRVKAVIGGQERWQMRQIVFPGCGGPLVAHFGLGNATKVDTVRVEWPSGIVQEFQDSGGQPVQGREGTAAPQTHRAVSV